MSDQKVLQIAPLIYAYAQWLEDNPVVRNKKGHIHASDLCGGPGRNCDRFIEYIRVVEERINPADPFPAAIRPTFWVGEGIELMADDLLPKVFKQMLPSVGCKFVAFHKQVKGFDEEVGIVVHADYLLEYINADGEHIRHVIDCKSTSSNQDKRRAAGSRGRPVSSTDSEHVIQVAIYRAMLNAEHGSVLYITKQHPHRISDGSVDGDRVWDQIVRRIKKIDDDLSDGIRALPNRGAHCAKCRWSEFCQEDV